MVSVTRAVQDIVSQNFFLQEAISHGIVSYNKLADYISPEIEKALGNKPKKSSIVMAIRRHVENIEAKQKQFSIGFFRETLLKTDMCYIIVEESDKTLNKIQELYNKMELRNGLMFHIVHANYEIGIITNKRVKDQIVEELSDEKIKRVVDDLVIVSLTYSKDYLYNPGIIYYVTRFLTWENINIFSIWLTSQEFNLLISRDDMTRAYSTVEKLIKKSNENNGNGL